jgi:asparagine synthase (glutamine-hydrolysing)
VCGIIAAAAPLDLTAGLVALAHRGPDATATALVAGIPLGHARLAIQDPSPRSDQPFTDGPVTIAYNGELFNGATVRATIEAAAPGRVWATTGDTETFAAALATLGPAAALRLLDGMFAVAWADTRHPGTLFLARDRHGEVPLHVHRAAPLMAASELKAFRAHGRRCGPAVVDVQPGTWWEIRRGHATVTEFHRLRAVPAPAELGHAAAELARRLATAVDRRVIADVPVCSLLSGGIDSAAIALELTRHHPSLVCYTARMDPKSPDLRCARETAAMLGVDLVEVDVPPPTADDLGGVIRQIEMPYKAQIEIAWACLRLAERIAADGFKVTYSGEGSDELWASYGFAYHGLQTTGWHTYRRDLIAAQAVRNFPRVNKAFMAHAVEARLPFLDPDVVRYALSLPRTAVQDGPSHPKAVLQHAYTGRLPAQVTKRPKLAFQDGLGLKKNIAAGLPNPARFYRAEYRRLYQ